MAEKVVKDKMQEYMNLEATCGLTIAELLIKEQTKNKLSDELQMLERIK